MNERFFLDYALSTPTFASGSQPRVVYALLNIRANAHFPRQRSPVNIVLLIDVSDSMKTPVLADDLVEELAARGLISPAVMDGMPVFRLEQLPDDLAARAKPLRSLDFVHAALESLSERLSAQDGFALVAFASEARSLLTSRAGSEKRAILRALEQLGALQLGHDTLVATALEQAIDEAERGRSPDHVDRIVLLTDGFAGDEVQAYGMAQGIVERGLAVTTIGLGFVFNEGFLIGLAEATGGNAHLVFDAADLPRLFANEFESSQALLLSKMSVELRPSPKVQLRHIYRIQPALAELTSSQSPTGSHLLNVGALSPESTCSLLVEFVVPPDWRVGRYRLAEAIVTGVAPGSESAELQHCNFVAEVVEAGSLPGNGAERAALTPDFTRAIALAAVTRSLAVALAAIQAGHLADAQRLLGGIAERFEALGEVEAAATYREEAARLAEELAGRTTKRLRYATRRLTQPFL